MTFDEFESITHELREYFGKSKGIFTDHVLAIADRIDAEHERQLEVLYRDMSDTEYVELPKDADGECIHVEDMMERGEARGRVIALMLSKYPQKKWGGALHWGIQLEGEKAPTALDRFFHHYHAPTVEDILREFANEVYADANNEIRDRDFLCAKYATKLRELGVD